MTIFWRLLLAHLLSDFTLQFDAVNRLKRTTWWGMLLHCGTHLVVSVLFVWNWLPQPWVTIGHIPVNGWWALLLMTAVHYAIDEARIYTMRALGWKDGTVSFLADQALHFYVLFMISPVVSPGPEMFLAEKWIGIACMFVLVTHFTTVLVYFLEKDFFNKNFPAFDEKYFLIFERVVLWAFFFAGGYWWTFFALAWTVQIFYVRHKRIIDLSMLNVALNVLLTAGMGAWTRIMYYGSF